ncbi:MAG: hypothetical protein H8E20_03790 [Verrucomicrobia bacterium]|nr:hypothetical protein [Verrucomicrobiota bacterium]
MKRALKTLLFCGILAATNQGFGQSVAQPGDPVIASSANSPGSEGVANAIDGKPTKYLNFDGKNSQPSGFIVSPSLGKTLVTGLSMQTANDAPDRDVKVVRLEGSNDAEATAWDGGNWEVIVEIDDIPAITDRFATQTFSFENKKGYLHYRWTVVDTQGPSGCCMQIAEVGFLGGVYSGPSDITQPGDAVMASSSNSPGSEGVANAIDGQPTKYLNFDGKNSQPSGFVVTPSLGMTYVTGMALQSANDAPDRDPKSITLEGSNDDEITGYDSGNWQMIAEIQDIEPWTGRFQTKELFFDNDRAFKHYRWVVTDTQGSSGCCMQIAEVELLGAVPPADVTSPGDAIIASSSNSPGSEGVANAIDGQPTKYLNFDGKNSQPSGFVVTPSIGKTVVTGIHMQSANDAPDRDAKVVTLEGSNDDEIADYDSGNWQLITELNVPPYTGRFQSQVLIFDNVWAFKHYRWVVVDTQGPSGCCMQIAEVELLGGSAPKDVTSPGDAVYASSSNSPGSEGVANAIDGQPTKYLNFDGKNSQPSGFVVTPGIGATTITGISMQTANDAPDRDVKVVLIEGTNDLVSGWDDGANWTRITQIDDIPAIDDRFTTQEFYFANDKAYTSYRWTVVDTQGPSGCCMQIAEVEFLAATTSVDCDLAAFKRQPVDAVVLDGEPATFLVEVNGPWPLQWYKNGEPISGAVSTSYTTDAINSENISDKYSVQIVGCEMSSEVGATILDPATQPISIGLNFNGSGANGAPTASLPTDIAGVHLQAYWNNVTQGSGSSDDVLLNSLGEEALGLEDYEITVDFASGGNWGAGTGDANPTQRLLNGLIRARSEAHIEFQEIPDGNHTLIVYTVGIPLQFQNQHYKLVGEDEDSDRVIYTDQMNADQYNPIQRYFRGTSTDPNNRTLSNYVRFDNVKPVDGIVRFEWGTTTVGFDRGVAINAIQLILDNPALEIDAPSVVTNPSPTVAQEGSLASMTVKAAGEGLTYQWLKDGAAIPDGGKISGATTDTLTVNGLTEVEEGFYSLAIFNDAGSVISSRAKLSTVSSGAKITDDLVVHLKFDESSGSTASNSGSSSEKGSFYDDYGDENEEPVGADGLIGNAILINGIDSETYAFGVLPNYPKITENGTVSVWFNTSGIDGENAVILRNGSSISIQSENQFQITINNNIDGELVLGCQISAGPNVINIQDTEPLALDEWVHVALTVDGGQLRLYKNGKLVGVTDYLDRINGSTQDWVAIGANITIIEEEGEEPYYAMDEANPAAFSGLLDDLAIWHVARDAAEIASIYEKGVAGQDATKASVTIPDFVEPGVAADPEINVVRNEDGSLTVTFVGKLQTAVTVNGPWQDVDAESPVTLTADQAQLFGRAVSE